MTRPDISFVAHNLAKFCDDPGAVHWKAAMKVLRYFWRTKGLSITYGGVTSRGLTMSAYVDSDHATCQDSRRSVSCGAVILRGGAVSWLSRAQRVTASVSSELKYVALEEIVNETKFLRRGQEFIVPTLRSCTISIMENNQGTTKMANNTATAEEHATSTSSTTLFETPSRRDWPALFMLGVKSTMQIYSRRA